MYDIDGIYGIHIDKAMSLWLTQEHFVDALTDFISRNMNIAEDIANKSPDDIFRHFHTMKSGFAALTIEDGRVIAAEIERSYRHGDIKDDVIKRLVQMLQAIILDIHSIITLSTSSAASDTE